MDTAMYVWRSDALRDYGHGTIAAVGASVDDARARIMRHAAKWARTERDYWWTSQGDVPDEFTEFLRQVTADIAAPPSTETVLLIKGSA